MQKYFLNRQNYELIDSNLTVYVSSSTILPTDIIAINNSFYVQPFHKNRLNNLHQYTTINTQTTLPSVKLKAIRKQLCPNEDIHKFHTEWQKVWPHRSLHMSHVLHNIHNLFLLPKIKETTYKLITQSLPLGVRKWTGNDKPHCPMCITNTLETEHHLFFECPFTIKLQQQTINKVNHTTNLQLSPIDFLTGNLHNQNQQFQAILHLIFCIYFQTIWTARCTSMFHSHLPTTRCAAKSFFQRVNLAINTYLHHIKSESHFNETVTILKEHNITKINHKHQHVSRL